MKRLLALLLAVIMCFSLIACDMLGNGGDQTDDDTNDDGTNNGGTNDDGNNDDGDDDKNDNTGDNTTPGGSTGGNDDNTGNEDDDTVTGPSKVTYSVPAEGYDGSEVTITFSHTMGEALRNELDLAIERFNELYPNITIEHTQVGGYDDVRDTIKQELTAGNQPNIAYCYPDHVALYNLTKKVVALDSFIESEIIVTREDGSTEILGLTEDQINNYIDSYYEEGTVFDEAGTMYTLPMSKSTEVMYYNKTFFEKYNLQVPTTWDQLEAVCARILEIQDELNAEITKKNANLPKDEQIPLYNWIPLGYDSEANWFITMCEQYNSNYTSATGTKFLFNNKTNREFVAKFRSWYDKGYVTTQEIFGGYTSDIFKDQTSFMSIGSSAGATHQRPAKGNDGKYPFEVGITSIPQVDAENNGKVISQGPSLCILENTNRDEVMASWLFMKFLTTNVAFQADFGIASGYVPVIKSVANDENYKKFLDKADGGNGIAALSAKVCLEQESFYYTSPAFNGSSTARDQVGALLQKCFAIEGADDAAIDAAIEKAFEESIAECKYSVGQ